MLYLSSSFFLLSYSSSLQIPPLCYSFTAFPLLTFLLPSFSLKILFLFTSVTNSNVFYFLPSVFLFNLNNLSFPCILSYFPWPLSLVYLFPFPLPYLHSVTFLSFPPPFSDCFRCFPLFPLPRPGPEYKVPFPPLVVRCPPYVYYQL